MKTQTVSICLNGVDVVNGWESELPSELNYWEAVLEDHSIDTTVENDGIGSYEYWGAPGFDAGTDSVVIERAESIVVSVHLYDIPTQNLSELVSDVEDALYMERDVFHSVGDYDSIPARACTTLKLLYGHVVDSDAVLVFDVQWELY